MSDPVRAVPACLMLAACVTQTLPPAGYCAPPAAVVWSAAEIPLPSGSSRVEVLAALVGVRDLLLTHRSGTPLSPGERLRVIERVEAARVAIAATVAELSCEEARTSQAADYLTRKSSSTVQGLTVGSVVVAALTSIVAVFLSTRNARAGTQDATAISGGVVTAALGLGSLYVDRQIEFRHERNLLTEVWRGGAASTAFPPVVWGYLGQAAFANDQTSAIREKLSARWRRFYGLGTDRHLERLLFGDGGSYDAGALRTRASMLNELGAEVDLANQEIEGLALELAR